jgi:hypothetical protein
VCSTSKFLEGERRHVSFLDWVAILRLAVSRDRVRECRIVADEQADDASSDEIAKIREREGGASASVRVVHN